MNMEEFKAMTERLRQQVYADVCHVPVRQPVPAEVVTAASELIYRMVSDALGFDPFEMMKENEMNNKFKKLKELNERKSQLNSEKELLLKELKEIKEQCFLLIDNKGEGFQLTDDGYAGLGVFPEDPEFNRGLVFRTINGTSRMSVSVEYGEVQQIVEYLGQWLEANEDPDFKEVEDGDSETD